MGGSCFGRVGFEVHGGDLLPGFGFAVEGGCQKASGMIFQVGIRV